MQLKIANPSNKKYIPIALCALALSCVGLVFIYSASSYSATVHYGDAFFYVKKQAIALVAGLIFFFIGFKCNTEFLAKAKWCVLAISIILLALVLIPGLGTSSYGATRWIDLKFMTIQPSELSKFGFTIFLAGYMAEKPPVNLKNTIIPLLSGGIICGLIMAEPNMSITVVVGLSLIVMLFIGGIKGRYMAVLGVFVLIAGILLIVLEPYRMDRMTAFLDPWKNPKAEGYQLIQSYYALSSGGLFGVGLFKSRQKYLFLPFAESDFIFSVIGEETGLLGCTLLICLFFLYIYLGIKVSHKSNSRYHSFLSMGITIITAIQAIVNLAVVTGSIPPTGVPLPFVSSGGTSLVTFLFMTGILCNVARNHSN